MISSGDKLDLCLIMLETNSSYVRNGSIIALNDLYEQYGSNIKAYLGEAVDACSVDGTLYSIPVGSTMGESYGFLLRSDLLEKYGFDSSDRTVTFDEMTEMLAAIKEGEGSGFYPLYSGGSIDSYVAYDTLGTSASSGVIMLDGDTDTVVNLHATDEYASQIAAIDSVVAQYQEAIQGGKVDPAEQLPAFLKALEDAGINDVIAAKQAQYDEWKAAQ